VHHDGFSFPGVLNAFLPRDLHVRAIRRLASDSFVTFASNRISVVVILDSEHRCGDVELIENRRR
jgi:hypothetical protein